jgi:phosphopantetheinyl transferase
MPLYKEWISDTHSLAAIWKIEEEEGYFTERTKYESAIKHERRRLEHLAGRLLLKHLKHDFPILEIAPDQHDKPRLKNNQYFFSISHSFPYVAAIISNEHEKGIDIQCWKPRMEILQHKFLSPDEQQFSKNDPELITVAWTAKEAAYKYIGLRGIDFIEQLPIKDWNKYSNAGEIGIHPKIEEKSSQLLINYIVEDDFSCAFI